MSKVLQIIEGTLLQSGSVVYASLKADDWKGEGEYTQSINIDGVTSRSKVDIQVGIDVARKIVEDKYHLLAGNNNGEVTFYAFGGKPSEDLSLQLFITEVAKQNGMDVIWGNVI